MPHPHPFVGRKTELEQFESVLADPTRQVIVVVGEEAMGEPARRLEENRA